MTVTFVPVQLASSVGDEDGRLAFVDGRLVAILCRLGAFHGEQAGEWNLETAFGGLPERVNTPFATLDIAERWILDRRLPA